MEFVSIVSKKTRGSSMLAASITFPKISANFPVVVLQVVTIDIAWVCPKASFGRRCL